MIEWLSEEATRLITWGLVARGIALVFAIQLLSIGPQLLPLIGSRGLMPAGRHLDALRRDMPPLTRLRHTPGVLWLAHSDRAIRAWWLLALAGALAGAIGGPLAVPGQAVAWLVVWSFRRVARLTLPWDFALLEFGALAIFLPGRPLLPELGLLTLPAPLVGFAFHLAVFRVVFGFGSTKFFGARPRDRYFSEYVVEYEMLPTPLSWAISKLPPRLHAANLGAMAVTELVGPILLLVPGTPRLIGGALVVAQMIVIQLVGNYGHFNALVCVAAISALDPALSLAHAFDGMQLLSPAQLPFTALFALTLPVMVPSLLFNSWTAGWARWPAWERLPGPFRALTALARLIEPLDLVHPLGVFTPQPGAPVRFAPVLQGRIDGGPWITWPWRWVLTDADSRPAFIAPHHPRLDHGAWFDALMLDGTGWMHPTIFGDPYRLTELSHQDQLLQRLMTPGAIQRRLLGPDPFSGAPPQEMRAALIRGRYTSREQRRERGQLWEVQEIGEHLLPRGPRPDLWDTWRPPVELWHPETPHWRRAARPAAPLRAGEIDRVLGELLPTIRELAMERASGEAPWRWAHLPDVALALQRRYDRETLYALRRAAARMAMVAQVRLEALLWRPGPSWLRDVVGLAVGPTAPRLSALPAGADLDALRRSLTAWPDGPLWSLLRVGLLPRWALLHSEAAWRGLGGSRLALDEPIPTRAPAGASAEALGVDLEILRARAGEFDLARGMFLEGALNYAGLARQAARLEIFQAFAGPLELPNTGLAPGAVELCVELGVQHRALPRWSGWGAGAQPSPAYDYPRMYYDRDGRWRASP